MVSDLIQKYIVKPDDNIRHVIEVINNNKNGIAVVVNDSGVLVATITDGDIRRFMLSDFDLSKPCRTVMHDRPIVASTTSSDQELRVLIRKYRIRNIPIIDADGRPTKIVNFNDLIEDKDTGTTAVIMAGGEGRRLRPLTEKIPKPMIQVGDRPLLEQIVRNLKNSGIEKIYISVNYRADIIEQHFQNGANFSVCIKYLREEKQLGTAGALSLLDNTLSGPLLVINGDVMTTVSFERILEFHRQSRSAMSVAAMDYHLNIPYGVLQLAGPYVVGINEKPKKHFLCNAGIYVMEPDLLNWIPTDTFFNMTDLLKDTLHRGLPVATFPIHEYWVDIGNKDDLKRANKDYRQTHQRYPE